MCLFALLAYARPRLSNDAICTLTELNCITPRGRYDVKFFIDFVTANRTRTFTNFLIIFVFFCIMFGSVRSNRIEQFNIIQYLHDLNASYSVNFEVRFDRIEPNFD